MDAPIWEIIGTYTGNSSYWSTNTQAILPKSEYHEVPAPERWERVAASNQLQILHDSRTLWLDNTQFYAPSGYRWAWDKQEDGTLVIERKVAE